MKHFCISLLVAFAMLASVCVAQNTPPAAAAQQTGGDTDVYHVHFNKAALGQAAALASALSTPDPQAPMPNHFIVLRHQQGDDWDYCVIQHLGTKATVEITPVSTSTARNLSAWHADTFVSGPAWPEFAKAMGLAGDVKGTAASVYSVAVWRPAAGHRDQLQKLLRQADPAQKVQTGRVLLTHLEGAPWTFLAIDRYNSWQDFATDQTASVAAIGSGSDGWSNIREHATYHHDTLADRISPK